jgi:hypothetical protein
MGRSEAAEGCTHSKTLREIGKGSKFRQVLECAQPCRFPALANVTGTFSHISRPAERCYLNSSTVICGLADDIRSAAIAFYRQ